MMKIAASRLWVEITIVAVVIAGIFWMARGSRQDGALTVPTAPMEEPRKVDYFWQGVPQTVRDASLVSPPESNIRIEDYVGSESCKECHVKNYEGWSRHPHRWMNAFATDENVRGDFSGDAVVSYQGGRATFYVEKGKRRVTLERGEMRRTYQVVQTIGSRFYQSCIGKQIEGPEPADHLVWKEDLHIPFTYWIERGEWIPETHVGLELPDDERADLFSSPGQVIPYATGCATCHTTPPIGDWLVSKNAIARVAKYTPRAFSYFIRGYLGETHPEIVNPNLGPNQMPRDRFRSIPAMLEQLPASTHAAAMGISCENCHNGCRAHVANPKKLPSFFPASPHVLVRGSDPQEVWGRTPENILWICARCHTGKRPRLAGGMASSNSNELDDGLAGHCYLGNGKQAGPEGPSRRLTCVHCHDPHQPIGSKWQPTPAQDSAKCIDCHSKFDSPKARMAHTHHPEGSSGSNCMDCHMPRLTEGLQDVVRTHMIYSPTESNMIEENQPNACNICHADKPIDWTLTYFEKWYGVGPTTYSESKLATNYPEREKSAALGWLKGSNEFTRVVGADALINSNATWALPDLIDALDDPYLVNRQLAEKNISKVIGFDPREQGYHFYMSEKERNEPLSRLRAAVLKDFSSPHAPREDESGS